MGGGHVVGIGELVGVGGEVVPGIHGPLVGLGYGGVLLGELRVEVTLGVVLGAVEQIEADAQCKHVLALDNGFVVESRILERLTRHGGDVGNHDVVFVELEFGQRVERCEAGLLEMFLGDGVSVDDDRSPSLEPFAVGLERRGVHGDQDVAVVAGVESGAVGEVHLETRYACHGSLRGADFGGIVRERRDAVAQQRRCVGEKRACELHAVARIARKANDDILQLAHIGSVHV